MALIFNFVTKIMQVERRSKACFDYSETQLIFDVPASKKSKSRGEAKLALIIPRRSLSSLFHSKGKKK
jgi:hypothetical protein